MAYFDRRETFISFTDNYISKGVMRFGRPINAHLLLVEK